MFANGVEPETDFIDSITFAVSVGAFATGVSSEVECMGLRM